MRIARNLRLYRSRFRRPGADTDEPSGRRRGRWTSIILTSIEPVAIRQYLFGYMFPKTADGTPDRARIDAALPQTAAGLYVIAKAIDAGHLGGKSFRAADAFLIPILFYLQKTPEAGEIIVTSSALAPPPVTNRPLGFG